MFCTKCGTENPDNAMFCKSCGASLLIQERPQENTYTQPTSTTDDVVSIMRKHASSTKFLLASVFFAIGIGISAIMQLMVGVVPIDAVLLVFAVIGAFFIYNEGKAQGNYFKTTGITMLKTVVVINIVVLGIFAVLALVGMLIIINAKDILNQTAEAMMQRIEATDMKELFLNAFTQQGMEYGAEAFALLIQATIPLIVFGVFVVIGFSLLLYIPALRSINKIRKAAITNNMEGTVSAVLITLMYIIGGLSALSLLGGDLANGLQGIAYIMYAMVLQEFKRDLQEIA